MSQHPVVDVTIIGAGPAGLAAAYYAGHREASCRIIESLGMLPERRHLDAVRAFLAAHPVDSAKQAIAQTLERMEQDVALRERLRDDLSAWISAR